MGALNECFQKKIDEEMKENCVLRDVNGVVVQVDLKGYGVGIRLADLSNMLSHQLMRINLSNNEKISGSTEVFANLRQVQEIDLGHTSVHGPIDAFENCSRLRELRLSNTRTTGDIGDIIRLRMLEVLVLNNTDITGLMHFMANFPRLRFLDLNFCGFVKGDVKVFQSIPYLQVVALHNTQVFGDVSVFKFLSDLRVLCLGSTGVTGSVLVFKSLSLSALEVLDLRCTLVKGDSEDVSSLKPYKAFAFKGPLRSERISCRGRRTSLDPRLLQGLDLSTPNNREVGHEIATETGFSKKHANLSIRERALREKLEALETQSLGLRAELEELEDDNESGPGPQDQRNNPGLLAPSSQLAITETPKQPSRLLRPWTQDEIRERAPYIFDILDHDRRGTVNPSELGEKLRQFNLNLGEDQATFHGMNYFEVFDCGGDSATIEKDDFVAKFEDMESASEKTKMVLAKIVEMAQMMIENPGLVPNRRSARRPSRRLSQICFSTIKDNPGEASRRKAIQEKSF